jgi:Protein of unknown function (DUF3604)
MLAVVVLAACGHGSNHEATTRAATRRCEDHNPVRNAYFGDLHVHTTYSLDANVRGTRLAARDAYRFARGERIDIPPYDAQGRALRSAQLRRPLDFAAVTDHAEFFGETRICTDRSQPGYESPECVFYRTEPDQAFLVFNAELALPGVPQPDGSRKVLRLPFCGLGGDNCRQAASTVWDDVQAAAEEFDDRSEACRFTTFVGYEWTASPRSNNLHRNVIFASERVPRLPINYLDETLPELLWNDLARDCKESDGCSFLTIPHNSNLSGGLMFQTQDGSGEAFTTAYATTKQTNEPLIEIFQHKGSSECNRSVGLGVQDELCAFENLPYDNLTADRFNRLLSGKPMEQDFVNYALGVGLLEEARLGVNPFKYGLIADTDTHMATPGNVNEAAFPGHGGDGKAPTDAVAGLTDFIEYNPGGLAVLWAEQNERESLFAAMRRREAYGTSGPRMIVRFFGGWDLPSDQCAAADFARIGYERGVPMGGDLPPLPATDRKPRFAVAALRDAGVGGEPSEPLQRIQIVKGWTNEGQRKQAVFDVAGGVDERATVNSQTCETSGVGSAGLCAVWEDEGFDPQQHAFYYARVLQSPSCRWSTYQCLAPHIDCSDSGSIPSGYADCCNPSYPRTIQERAWTSPIWYRP